MALVIEDGTGVPGATSFVTRDEFIAYAAQRGVTVPDTDATDVYAFNAMDYFRYVEGDLCGERAYVGQPLPFPRKGVVRGDCVEDYIYVIPQAAKDVQLQLMLEAKNGVKLTPSQSNIEQVVKREKVGPLETEYFEANAGGFITPDLPLVDALLRPLQCGQSGLLFRTIRV